jgi:hypothetical protein
MTRPVIVQYWGGSPAPTITTSATGANHGAGQFAFVDTAEAAIQNMHIGAYVWNATGTLRGRVTSISHDEGSEYLVTVDTSTVFTTETELYTNEVNTFLEENNLTRTGRTGRFAIPVRRHRDPYQILRVTSKDVAFDNTGGAFRISCGGQVSKVRVHVTKATPSAGKILFLGFHTDENATVENGDLRWDMTKTGIREYGVGINTKLPTDVVTGIGGIAFCNSIQLTCNCVGVVDADLPEWEMEVYVDWTPETEKHLQAITASTATLIPGRPASLDSTSNAITATLGSGGYIGQMQTIVMTNATNASTVSVTNHETSDPEVFTFDAVDEYLTLVWTGTEWATLNGTATT